MTRFLRSKQDRAWLWYRADGKCERCGMPLDPGWHADHVVPWSVSGRTIPEEMQALCPQCNEEKGRSMLRRHQREFKDLFEQIRAGHREGRMILLSVTPGGGKSAIPVIGAAAGIPRIGEAICVVTPRESLQSQMEDAFLDPLFRRLLGHNHKVRLSTNQEDPCRGLSGYVTTYQALVADHRGINRMEFDRKPYILVLDEVHHLEEGGEYHQAVEPLVDRATAVVLMTGTLERANGKRIAYVPYRRTIDERWTVETRGVMPVVEYSRKDGLEEHAIIPLVFQHLDGEASWIDRDGQMVAPLPISLAGSQTSDAIFTALRTDYARDLLDRCVRDWLAYKRRWSRAKLLVVAPTIKLAKQYLAWLKERGVPHAEIATTDNLLGAKKAIDAFRLRELDAIVTVGMAYEGLDCKSITHVACLTHIRSRPWIEQLISRANRFDPQAGTYEGQRGFVYAPDDQEIVQIFEEIRVEQEPFIREERERAEAEGQEDRPDPVWVVPIDGRGTKVRAGSLDGETLDYAETEAILGVLQELGYEGVMSPTDMLIAHRKLEALSLSGPTRLTVETAADVRPSKEEAALRESIEAHCRGWDHDNGQTFGTLNKVVFQRFGKPRPDMSIAELREVWAWLNREYARQQRA